MIRRFVALKLSVLAGILLSPLCPGVHLHGMETLTLSKHTTMDMELDFRTYSLNDQRLYWSGVEFSFGAEAAIAMSLRKKNEWSSLTFDLELFLNQPFGGNILTDEFRDGYSANFEVDTLEISRMNLRFDIGRFSITLGKDATPFGRADFPSHTNNLGVIAPFIRSEAILWRETGIFLHWENRFLEVDVAAVNGGEDRDTNSGKAGIFRLGFHGRNWHVGASHKIHDGTGSEWQKQYKGHTGIDAMIRFGSFRISGEWIRDRYGFHRPYDESEIFWARSLYYRDTFLADKTPIKGSGWYGEISYISKKWLIDLSYGEYHPQEIGNILHDLPNKRFTLWLTYRFIPEGRFYLAGLIENDREKEPWSEGAKPFAALAGCEFTL